MTDKTSPLCPQCQLVLAEIAKKAAAEIERHEVKLKRARGARLRAIRAGLITAPPGYMSAEEMDREEAARKLARSAQLTAHGEKLKRKSKN
jgi:hypothetical protein